MRLTQYGLTPEFRNAVLADDRYTPEQRVAFLRAVDQTLP